MPKYSPKTYTLRIDGKTAIADGLEITGAGLRTCVEWSANYDPSLQSVEIVSDDDGAVMSRDHALMILEDVKPAASTDAPTRPAASSSEALPELERADEDLMARTALHIFQALQQSPGVTEAETCYLDGVGDCIHAKMGDPSRIDARVKRIAERLKSLGFTLELAPAAVEDSSGSSAAPAAAEDNTSSSAAPAAAEDNTSSSAAPAASKRTVSKPPAKNPAAKNKAPSTKSRPGRGR